MRYNRRMRTIGVRELHQNTSEWLRLVKDGDTLQVTEHGHPVAMITGIPDNETPLERMVREGKATPASGDLLEYLDAHPPLPAVEGVPLPSEMLAEMRANER